LKKKYEKPKLSSLNMPVVKAQGFEVMGVCSTGSFVGDGGLGDCNTGFLPKSLLGNCSPGSGDSAAGSSCSDGSWAGTSCGLGSDAA
jgi:hypothetical protein